MRKLCVAVNGQKLLGRIDMIKRLVITGYKPYELRIFQENHPGIKYIKKAIRRELEKLLAEGLEWIITSGQPGVEMWTVEVVFELQEKYPDLKYAILPPFLDQEKRWREHLQEKYHELLLHADFHQPISNRPYEGPWQYRARDKFLLRNSDALLLVYDEEQEGSPKFIKNLAEQYAKRKNYPIIMITSYDLQLLVEEEQFYDW